MDNSNEILSSQLLLATEALAVSLCHSGPFVQYDQARGRLEADSSAQSLLNHLTETQSEIRRLQVSGKVAPNEIEKLHGLQSAVQANAIIMDYARTQQSAIAYLRVVNQEISQLLGLDFAALAKRPGCC